MLQYFMFGSLTALTLDRDRRFPPLPLTPSTSVPSVYPDRVAALKSPFNNSTPRTNSHQATPASYHFLVTQESLQPLFNHTIAHTFRLPWGVPPAPHPTPPYFFHTLATRHSPLATIFPRINTCKTDTKQTTSTPFRINTYEKTRGGGQLSLTSVGQPILAVSSQPSQVPDHKPRTPKLVRCCRLPFISAEIFPVGLFGCGGFGVLFRHSRGHMPRHIQTSALY